MLQDAEMPVSDNIWEKIEQRIDTKPEKPKYWMLFMLLSIALPSAYLAYQSLNVDGVKIGADSPIVNLAELGKSDSNAVSTYPKSDLILSTNNESTVAIAEQNISLNTNAPSSVTLNKSNLNTYNSSEIAVASSSQTLLTKELDEFITEENIYDEPYGLNSVLVKWGRIEPLAVIKRTSIAYFDNGLEEKDPSLFDGLFSAKPKCPKFKNNIKGIYAWIDYTSAIPFQNLSVANSEYKEYVNQRTATETPMYSFHTGLGLGYVSPSGFLVEAGLVYDQINVKFSYNIPTVEVSTETFEIFDEAGNLIDWEESTVSRPGFYEIKHRNKFEQFDIPLLIGYEMPINPKFRMSVKGGVNMNITSSNQGRVLTTNNGDLTYGSDSDHQLYKTKFGLGYLGSVNLLTSINDRLSLSAGLNIKYYNNINADDNVVYHSISKVGLSTGVQYRIL